MALPPGWAEGDPFPADHVDGQIEGTGQHAQWHNAVEATLNALPQGPPGLVFRGTWNGDTTYAKNDAVFYEGSSYIAVQGNTGVNPAGDDEFETWHPLALGGSQGGIELVTAMPKYINVTATSWAPQYDPTIFDLSQYPEHATVHFRADLSQGNEGSGLVEVRLTSFDAGNAAVAGSTLSATVAQYNHSIQISGDLRAALQPGAGNYGLEAQVENSYSGQILSPQLVVRF